MLPFIERAYAKQNIEELKSFYIQKTQSSSSLYKVLIQHEQLICGLYKVLQYPSQGFAKALRDNLSYLTTAMSLPSMKHYFLSADPCIIYECGVLKIKTLRDIKSKTPYEPKNITEDPFRHRKHNPLDCYGKYKDLR